DVAMPSVEYSRVDFNVEITVDDERQGTVAWSTGDGWVTGRQRVSVSVITTWTGGADPTADLPSMIAALTEWLRSAPPSSDTVLRRVTLDIDDADVGGAAWEAWLGPRLVPWSAAVVRTTRARPRGATMPLTLPIRVVELDMPPVTMLGDIFGGAPADEIALAF